MRSSSESIRLRASARPGIGEPEGDAGGLPTLRFTPASSHDYDAPAMPEANVLYSVTGVVLVGLVAWVAMVLKSAKEPWVRPAPAELPSEEAPASTEEAAGTNKLDADDTSRATPVALSEGRAKTADKVEEEEKKAEGAGEQEEKKAEA